MPGFGDGGPHAAPDSGVRGQDASERRALTRRGIELTALAGVPVAAGMFVVLLAAARWPKYWAWIAPEQTPMTWLESVLLVLCAAVALLLAAAWHLRGLGGALVWLTLAAGFGFLALDERFALHERVRDGYLAPRGVAPSFLPWVAPGDFLLLGYGVLGLALLPFVLRVFRGDRLSLGLLFAGAALAVLAVAGDSFNVHTMSLTMEIREQTAEEVVELASSTCFLLALWLRLVPILAPAPARSPDRAPAALCNVRAYGGPEWVR